MSKKQRLNISASSGKSFATSSDFVQPLLSSTSEHHAQLPILMQDVQSSHSQPHSLHSEDHNLADVSHTPHNIYCVDDDFSINKQPLQRFPHKNRQQRKSRSKRLTFSFSSPSSSSSPWNRNVKNVLLRKLRNQPDTNAIRYIRRDKTAESNVLKQGFITSRGYSMFYFKLIDRPWLILVCELFLIYTSIYVFFATLFYYMDYAYNTAINPDIVELYRKDYWFLCFNFAVHTGTSIGFGYLLPKDLRGIVSGFTMLMLIYFTEIFEVLLTGVFIDKLRKPTRLKTQLRFSECAVVNNGYCTTHNDGSSLIDTSLKFQSTYPRHQYSDFNYDCGTIHDAGSYKRSKENDKYECLMFRFCHIRPQSRMCMPTMTLLYYEHRIVGGARGRERRTDWMKHKHQELDYEMFKKQGRMRSDDNDIPMLSLPWTAVHKIDECSPLFGLSKKDLSRKKIEIIVVAGGIDEITSDNFQKWWSYTAEEIMWNHQFEAMVKCIVKQDITCYQRLLSYMKKQKTKYKEVLEIDFDRLSLISPIIQYEYT